VEERDNAAQVEAVRALGASESPQAFVAIAKIIGARDAAVRRAAAEILERQADSAYADAAVSDNDALAALVRATAGEDDSAAEAAALVLRRSTSDEVHGYLADVMRHGDPAAKRHVIWTQHHMATDDEIAPDIARALVDPDDQVRQTAYDALRGPLSAALSNVVLRAAAETSEENAWLAIRCLTKSDPTMVKVLISALRRRDTRVCRVAARALQSAEGDEVVDALAQAARRRDPVLRAAALKSLRHRLEPGAKAALALAVTDPNEQVRALAVDALSHRPLSGAVPTLVSAIGHHDISVRRSVVELLGSYLAAIPPNEWNTDVAIAVGSLTADPDPSVRIAAIRALRGATVGNAIEPLLSALTDKDGSIRREAAIALRGRAIAGRRHHHARVIEELINASRDDLPTVRTAALESLGYERSSSPAVVEAAKTALKDPSTEVRIAGVHLLHWTTDSAAISALVNLFAQEENTEVRRAVVSALGSSETEAAAVALAIAIRDPETSVADMAVAELSRSPALRSTGLLIHIMLHGDPNASARAARALWESGQPDVDAFLFEVLSNRDPEVRLKALEALTMRRTLKALPAIEVMTHDPDPHVRSLATLAPRYMSGGFELIRSQGGFDLVPVATRAVGGLGLAKEQGLSELERELFGPEEVIDAFTPQRLRAELSRRYVNVVLADALTHDSLPRDTKLRPGRGYKIRIDVGALSSDSAVENAGEHPFPDSLIDTSSPKVKVIVVSNDFHVPQASHELTIPSQGRSEYLYIPVQLKDFRKEGSRLRLLLYHKSNCLMSLVLWVGQAGEGYITFIDYALTADLSQMTALDPQTLALHTSLDSDGVFRLFAHSSGKELFSADLSFAQVGAAADAARNTLIDIHFDSANKSRYQSDNGKTASACRQDLAALAECGWTLYSSVMAMRARNEFTSLLRTTAAMLGAPSRVQVCIASGGQILPFPWQLVYDIPCTGGPPKFQDCPTLDAWLNGSLTEIPDTCPHAHSRNTLCPFGFWGFAYELAAPPSSNEHNRTLTISSRDRAAQTIAVLNRTLDPRLMNKHLDDLRELFRITEVDHLTSLEDALYDDDPDIVYFYCHGRRRPFGRQTWKPVLEIGRGEEIVPEDLAAWAVTWPAEHWKDPRPLVVLNGCHTSEVTPEMLMDWITLFEEVRAAGSIGTEVALTQSVATEAMQRFLAKFANGNSAAASLRAMRWNLLRTGNVMGLAYTLYAYGGLTMRPHQGRVMEVIR
jgi:HEAT repeat protein